MKKLISMLIVLVMLAAVATSAFAFGVGSVQELVIGENTAEYNVVYDEEYEEYIVAPVMYMWTAEEAGTLTIDFSDEDEATVQCYIIYNNAEPYDILEKGGQVSIEMAAGTMITLEIYNAEDHIYESAVFHFTATFEAGAEVAGEGTEENPWIVESMPSELKGTISEADAANEEWAGYFYQFTATELGVVSWGPFTGCGLFVTLNDEWVDADYVEVVAGDIVVFNVWALFGAGEYSAAVNFTAGEAEEEGCTHEWMYLEPDFCYEDENMYDLVEKCDDCGYVGRRYTPGTEKNPILVDFLYDEETGNMSGSVTVPAGETLWFGQYRIGGMILMVNGVEYGMLEAGSFFDPVVFELSNDTAEDVTYELLLTWPLGTDYNPDEMPVNGSTELYLPEDSYEYVYGWTATEDGELTVTVDGENWLFYFYNLNTYEQTEHAYDCYDNANTVTIQVSAGDEIRLYVGTQDADWNAPEATLTITTVFTPAAGEGPCAHEGLVHMDAVEPGCHFEGNIEYWVCYDCGGVWQDEALTQVTNILRVVLPAVGGDVIHVEAKAPTCYEDGNIEHWYCEKCEQVWQDEALTQLTNHMNVKLGAGHTNLVHMDAVEPGCHFNGNIEYWVCYGCECVWADEALTQVTNILRVVVPAVGGEVVHVEAKAPTCTEEGNIEHWYCEKCEQVWQDEALTQLTNHMNVKLGVAEHTFVNGVCSVCGANDQNVPPTGDMISLAFALIAVSGMTVIALPKKKEN